jgi:DNA polymerase/3'-5' exonuclease PolX
LNEYQLTDLKTKEKVEINKESDIFDALNMEYQLPADRM